jgi:DNA-binding NarL/FixJ family response regulator
MANNPTDRTAPAVKRILLVDDHPMLRQGLEQYIQEDDSLTVCGQAGNAADALTLVGTLRPDLIVVDIGLPGRDGLDLIKDIRACDTRCGILVFSMFDEDVYAERALRAGAQGYVMKHESPQKLLQAIRSVLQGELVTGNGVIQRVLRRTIENHRQPAPTSVSVLSNRELEIFRLIGSGLARGEIARQLHLSVKTFEAHRARIRQKMGLKNAPELFIHASRFVHDGNHQHAETLPLNPDPKD